MDPIGLKPGCLPYTKELGDVSIIRHAVSLDERRAFFRSNLVDQGPRVKQVWFAGVHSDVGGGYSEAESGLSSITFRWMLDEAAQSGLTIDPLRVQNVLEDVARAKPVATAPLHNSLTPAWWIGELWPKFVKKKISPDGAIPAEYRGRPRLNLFRRRFVPEGSVIHGSVLTRMKLLPAYHPSNLPKYYFLEPDHQSVEAAIQLRPGTDEIFGIFASSKWNNTRLEVQAGQTYTLAATGTWYDAHIKSSLAGYRSGSVFMRLSSLFKRRPKDNWFALIGTVGQHEKNSF